MNQHEKAELMMITGVLHDTAEMCRDDKAAERIRQVEKRIEKLINYESNEILPVSNGCSPYPIMLGC